MLSFLAQAVSDAADADSLVRGVVLVSTPVVLAGFGFVGKRVMRRVDEASELREAARQRQIDTLVEQHETLAEALSDDHKKLYDKVEEVLVTVTENRELNERQHETIRESFSEGLRRVHDRIDEHLT